MFRNMTMSLIRHERIITTVAKAKEARPFIEKLITIAKRGDLQARRLVVSRLGATADAEVHPYEREREKETDTRTIIQKLFDDIAPRFADRPGGYTRIIKRHERRLGDGGATAYLELLKAGETKAKAKIPAAPQIEEEEPQEEMQEKAPTSEEQGQPEGTPGDGESTQASDQAPQGEKTE